MANNSLITTKGIVIRERSVGENDKFIDILTDTHGVIEASVKGVKKITAKNSSSSQLFVYSKLCFNKHGDRYILNSSEPIELFYNIRLDIVKFSLASYFSELVKFTVTSEEPNENVLRLFLNTLHFLSTSKLDGKFLKPIFELRLLSEIGLMPNLLGCVDCMKYEGDMFFFLEEGLIRCKDCASEISLDSSVKIDETMLHILRFITLSDLTKIYNFKISDKYLTELSYVSERYLSAQIKRHFKTLDFYKSLL